MFLSLLDTADCKKRDLLKLLLEKKKKRVLFKNIPDLELEQERCKKLELFWGFSPSSTAPVLCLPSAFSQLPKAT